MKPLDTTYLDVESPADSEVRFLRDETDNTVMLIEIDMPNETLRLRMTLAEAKKLAVRWFTAAKQIGGELGPNRESIN